VAGPVVRVEGAAKLSRDFRAAGGTVRELSGAYREVARSLVPPAKREAPARSGRLAASTRGLGQRTRAILTAGTRAVPYAGPVHFGNPTVKTYPAHKSGAKRSTGTLGVIRPNPWLYRTADTRRDEVNEAFESNVGKVLNRYGLASPLSGARW
jgi:hypothetical protein